MAEVGAVIAVVIGGETGREEEEKKKESSERSKGYGGKGRARRRVH